MPKPKPKNGESKTDWMSRCMADANMMKDYPGEDDRNKECESMHSDMTKGAEMEKNITKEQLSIAYPDLFAAIQGEAASKAAEEAYARGKAEGTVMGAQSERTRIMDVRGQLIPGHEALIEALASDGTTTGPEAAVKVLAAEKVLRESRSKDYLEDGMPRIPAASAEDFKPATDTAKTLSEAGDKLDRFAKEIKRTEKCTYSEALVKAKAAHPALAKIYEGGEE
ncbi:MAG: ClpP class periplasmic serine protease [Candidatus Gottesmanbacteria bacterium GW2011_GWB1_49_7]|uniref:ClpP class periplasmic serine protease n=1 Tax=Candidatus Gottesmanbacteria bacterium GW2011_GWB1_49_7 TaxID=1618448 RepID=A0A0G1YCI6_9BACT|nr:MAG: ClpP class periplasmic serine protease [Candidatus Gottesmanbacteria bacterium GW2011_GWB1_49_7]